MHNLIKALTNSAPSDRRPQADDEFSQARLKLEFLTALFVACWVIGAWRMGNVGMSDYSAPLLGTLLGM